MTFKDLNITEPILKAIEEKGYANPTPIQVKAIPAALTGKDILGCAQTGTGKTASADQAQEIHAHIRQTIAGKYGQTVADDCSILYGGSCNAKNAPELFAQPDIDGGLIGGASLKVADFKAIIDAF